MDGKTDGRSKGKRKVEGEENRMKGYYYTVH